MHSLNYLLYTCSPRCKTSVLVRGTRPVFAKEIRPWALTPTHPKKCTRPYRRDVALTWPWIHRSGCGKNSCTATGRSSPGKQVHLRPRRAPAAGRATFWPTFTHTQPDYMRPSLRPQKPTWLAFSLNLYQFYPHGFLPPLRCPIVIRLLWVLR